MWNRRKQDGSFDYIFVFMLLYFVFCVCCFTFVSYKFFLEFKLLASDNSRSVHNFILYAHIWRCVWICMDRSRMMCMKINDWSRTAVEKKKCMRNLIRVISCYFRNLSSALLSFKCLDKKIAIVHTHFFFHQYMGEQRYFWGSRD